MNFYLNNEHRKYMGIKELKNDYELVKLKKGDYEIVGHKDRVLDSTGWIMLY